MTRPGEMTLRDWELVALGMAMANGSCRDWLLASLSSDDFVDAETRRLFVAVREGRDEMNRLMTYLGEPLREGERWTEPVKRLLIRRAIEAAPGSAALGVSILTRGKNVTPAMALEALDEARSRLQKLADAEAALRPEPKETVTT
jgi:hypothetical protein